MMFVYAVLLGTSFGFILEKTGAANPKRVVDMLLLKEFHLMKTILCAIATGSFLLYLLLSLEFISASHLSIKDNYIGVAIGGGILGLGWAMSGYCPGTGLVGTGAGRKDGILFVIGGCVGAWLYMLAYQGFVDSFLFNPLFGNKETLANGYIATPFGLPAKLRSLGIASLIAWMLMIIAWALPTRTEDRAD